MEAHLCFINSTVRLFRIECIVDTRRGNAMSKERRWYDLKISVDAYQLGRSIASKEELQRTKKDLKLFQTLNTMHIWTIELNYSSFSYPRYQKSIIINKNI